jgi:hypothetical protein
VPRAGAVSRTAKDSVRRRRAIVVLMSPQGQAVRDICSLVWVGEDYVREVTSLRPTVGWSATMSSGRSI